jgi:hypothetical protein
MAFFFLRMRLLASPFGLAINNNSAAVRSHLATLLVDLLLEL